MDYKFEVKKNTNHNFISLFGNVKGGEENGVNVINLIQSSSQLK